MDDTPNPYRPPQAPVDPHVDAAPHGLRMLLRGLVIAQIVLTVVAFAMPDTLPPALKQARDAASFTFFNRYPALPIAAVVLLIAGLGGLWQEKRWGAWAYITANVVGYAIQLLGGPSINSEVGAFVDSIGDVFIGATLVVLYFGGYFAPAPREERR